MKKLLLVGLLALVGCGESTSSSKETPKYLTSEGKVVENFTADEYCYDGVVYVRFPVHSHQAFGGVKFNRDGQVVTCVYAASKEAIEQLRRAQTPTN